MARVLVVGGGIVGITSALALRARGHEVRVIDAGPLPHPLAESTDISKIVRLDYGDDETYTELMERALPRWRAWSAAPLFHETGTLFVRRTPLSPGTFEHDSLELLERRGHRIERLDAEALRRRFPAWNTERYAFGYFNPQGGWAESGAVVSHLAREAKDAGVVIAEHTRAARLIERGAKVTGVETAAGDMLAADRVIVTGGAWTTDLVPELDAWLTAVGQPVFHLAPDDVSLFTSPRFAVFGADIANTGYYGFPANRDGLVKIANHGVGRRVHPSSEASRVVTPEQTEALRAFLRDAFPDLAGARIAATRLCVYGDTRDQHFWIAPHPDREGLVVAAGGSGHAFKFAPLLGDLVADAMEGAVHPKFRWRADLTYVLGEERARHQGEEPLGAISSRG